MPTPMPIIEARTGVLVGTGEDGGDEAEQGHGDAEAEEGDADRQAHGQDRAEGHEQDDHGHGQPDQFGGLGLGGLHGLGQLTAHLDLDAGVLSRGRGR